MTFRIYLKKFWGSYQWNIPTLLTLRFHDKLPLDRNILAHPWHLHFYVPPHPKYSFAPPSLLTFLTKIFFCIPDTSISTYLLEQNILAHTWHLHFYVSSWPKYSCASLTPQCLRSCSTKIFFCISISTRLLHLRVPNQVGSWIWKTNHLWYDIFLLIFFT